MSKRGQCHRLPLLNHQMKQIQQMEDSMKFPPCFICWICLDLSHLLAIYLSFVVFHLLDLQTDQMCNAHALLWFEKCALSVQKPSTRPSSVAAIETQPLLTLPGDWRWVDNNIIMGSIRGSDEEVPKMATDGSKEEMPEDKISPSTNTRTNTVKLTYITQPLPIWRHHLILYHLSLLWFHVLCQQQYLEPAVFWSPVWLLSHTHCSCGASLIYYANNTLTLRSILIHTLVLPPWNTNWIKIMHP